MTKTEIAQLARLIKKLKAAKLYAPNLPQEIWCELNTLVPWPAVEVLITRTGSDFLLTKRKDEYWQGWHIPGGFMLYKESIQEACNRVAKRELGIEVVFKDIVDAYAWPDHPYAAPLSLTCVCQPKSKQKPKQGKYFQKIPSNLIVHHDLFLKAFLKRRKK